MTDAPAGATGASDAETGAPDAETDYSRVYRDLSIPTGDGEVAATRHEPTTGDGPRPVVLTYTPYHKDDLSDSESDPLVRYFAERGYEVVVADVVGTGASEGLADAPFTAAEGRQGAAVVEWLADREWTTGKVGVVGKSYPGTTALEIAAERPEGLAAIVPVHAPTRPYDSYFDGGALTLLRACGVWAPNFEYLPAQPPARRDGAGEWARRWHDRLDGLRDRDPYLFQYLDHRRKDDYWAAKDVPVERIQVPTLAVGGYRDAFAESTAEYADLVDAPTRLILGPWRHATPDAGRQAAIDFLGEVEQWFDQFLRGEDAGALDAPTVRYFTERGESPEQGDGEGGPERSDGEGNPERNDGEGSPERSDGDRDRDSGVWRGRDSWPRVEDGDAATLDFALTADGLAEPDAVGGRSESTWEPDWSVGAASVGFDVPNGRPLDTGPDDARSVTYDSEPLSDPVELTGTGEAELTVVPETTDPLVAVRVVDVAPDGTARLVTHGVRRASIRGDPDPLGAVADEPEPLTPGEAATVTVPLRPKSHVFGAGHRIRVAVSGAFFPYVLPPADAGGFAVVSTPDRPSVVRFPGRRRDGGVDFDRTASFDPPREAYAPAPASPDWETARHHGDGRASVSLAQSFSKSLPEATFDYEMSVDARVDRDDPTSAVIERTTETTLDYGTESVRTRVWNEVSRDAAHLTYDVSVDGEQVFSESKRWHRGE